VLKRAYFMTVIDGVFRLGGACDKQTRDVFQSSRLTGVTLWAVITYNTPATVARDRKTAV